MDSETVVHSVESSLPELAAKVSTQIDGVGENIESYGHSIITGTTELFSQVLPTRNVLTLPAWRQV